MDMLEQVQRGGAAAVEQLDVGGLRLERIGALQGIHERINFDSTWLRDRGFVGEQIAHLRDVAAHLRIRISKQRRQHAQALAHRSRRIQCEHGQTSALMGMVRFFSLPNRLVSLVPSEQPLPKLKPQPPRTLKVFSAYSR